MVMEVMGLNILTSNNDSWMLNENQKRPRSKIKVVVNCHNSVMTEKPLYIEGA